MTSLTREGLLLDLLLRTILLYFITSIAIPILYCGLQIYAFANIFVKEQKTKGFKKKKKNFF